MNSTTHSNEFTIYAGTFDNQQESIPFHNDIIKVMEMAKALEYASNVRTIRVYMNETIIHDWKRPRHAAGEDFLEDQD